MLKKTLSLLATVACAAILLTGCSTDVPTVSDTTSTATDQNQTVVPFVKGLDADTAIKALEDQGFIVEVNEDVEDGTSWVVRKQVPEGGEKAAKGSTVTLTLIDERTPTTNPDTNNTQTMAGLTQDTAIDVCVARAESENPGFEVLWQSDKVDVVVDSPNITFSALSQITEGDMVTEVVLNCVVTGTEESPEITTFEIKRTF